MLHTIMYEIGCTIIIINIVCLTLYYKIIIHNHAGIIMRALHYQLRFEIDIGIQELT